MCSPSSLLGSNITFQIKLRMCSESFWVQSEATHGGTVDCWPFHNWGGELTPSQSLELLKEDGA